MTAARAAACLVALTLALTAAPPATSLAQTHVTPTQTHV
jgi:hypothetical protein